MRSRFAVALVLAAAAAAPAVADPRAPEKLVTDDCAKARRQNKDCVLTIEGHEIDGKTPGGTGMTVTARTDIRHASLIRIRYDFIQEIVKSAEDL